MDRTAQKSGGLKLDDQIRKLQKISDMLLKASILIDEINGTASEMEFALHELGQVKPGMISEAYRLARDCKEHCSCAVCRATDKVLWRHLLIKYNCDERDKMEIEDRAKAAKARLRAVLEKIGGTDGIQTRID